MSGFARLLRAEWTKLRTVRGWTAGIVVSALLVTALGLVFASGSRSSCGKGPVEVPCPATPIGPGGQGVDDRFYFVHQPLDGDGAITVRVNSMTGQIRLPDATPGIRNVTAGVVPWAKAGVMVKESTKQGAPYAAVMLTGEHGVRMQHNFTEDVAGTPGRSPRWLRITRTGDTITGEESADGRRWAKVGTARLAGLPSRVRIGLFAASPGDLRVTRNPLGGAVSAGRFAEVTAVMDQVGVRGAATGRTWSQDDIGVDYELDGVTPHHPGRFARSGDTFTVTGVGDIAPKLDGYRVENILIGLVTGLIVSMVVAVLFITVEYRRGLIRTTLAATPRRGRVLAAKAVVIGAVVFLSGLVAAAVTILAGKPILRGNGIIPLPVPALTELRVIAGAAGLFAASSVLALALGALLRRSAIAVIAAVVAVILPYVLGVASILPEEVSEWLLRLTPAAGFAVLQSVPEYAHVIGYYAPVEGYYPLPPWGGFAVSCAYAGLALALAVVRLRREDV
ncbi:ABC transporter permease subunit [Nonomuraea sp. NPDC046802]|uniref:ABC transporter permease subunit n=1 Tax=Nonomuraea sp. NPDC046802 TaxID=3154919 RepID=UPI003407510E